MLTANLTFPSLSATNLTYRKDIDGLRAIAVLAVIIFHTESFGLSGGFVGVDIFFVISGYLITQRIAYRKVEQKFSYKEFYTRRLRRLFPALATTSLATLIAGLILLPPEPLTKLAISIISTTFSVANIQFFLESGYWDASSWSKPMLHMWSLGVEEQFYMAWPFLITFSIHRFRERAFLFVASLTLVSIFATTYATSINQSAAFYLTPFRIYEFGLGALCVWFDGIRWPDRIADRILRSGLFLAGILLISVSTIAFHESMAFPGAWALIPAGGAALVILARNPAGLGLILTNPFARYIGLISYSLYLVHWPVLVFLRRQHAELDPSTASVALLTIFFLSALQYHLVETPLRQPLGRKKAPLSAPGAFSRTALGALAGALVVIAGAIVVLTSGGFPSRYPETVYRIASLTRQDVMLPRRASRDLLCGAQQSGTICGKIDPSRLNILVLGDSMAIDGLNIFQAAFPEANYLISEHGGCPMLLSLENIGHSYDGCDSLNKKRMADISRLNGEFDFIILSQRLNVERIAVMEQTVKEFARSGARIIVLGVGPAFRADLAPLIAEHGTMEEIESAIQKYSITSDYVVDDRLAPVVRELRGVYVQRRPFFCQDNGRCRVVMRDGSPLSFDQHHLSLQASNEFGRYLRRTQPNLLTLREASSDSN